MGGGFNPTMVRLLLLLGGLRFVKLSCFNPTMVRLLRVSLRNGSNAEYQFQSHNGAIAAETFGKNLLVGFGFNPTMVRLLQIHGGSGASGEVRFNPTMVRLLRTFVRVLDC